MVFLAASKSLGIRCGRVYTVKSLSYAEYFTNFWFSHLIKLAKHILLSSPYNLLAIHLAGFRLNLEQEN